MGCKSTDFFVSDYMGGNFSILKSELLTFLLRLGLLVAIVLLLVVVDDPDVNLDYWIKVDKFADYNFRVLLELLFCTSTSFYKGFVYLDKTFANLGSLFNYCCCACYFYINDLVASCLTLLYSFGCLLRTCYNIV